MVKSAPVPTIGPGFDIRHPPINICHKRPSLGYHDRHRRPLHCLEQGQYSWLAKLSLNRDEARAAARLCDSATDALKTSPRNPPIMCDVEIISSDHDQGRKLEQPADFQRVPHDMADVYGAADAMIDFGGYADTPTPTPAHAPPITDPELAALGRALGSPAHYTTRATPARARKRGRSTPPPSTRASPPRKLRRLSTPQGATRTLHGQHTPSATPRPGFVQALSPSPAPAAATQLFSPPGAEPAPAKQLFSPPGAELAPPAACTAARARTAA